MAPMTVSSRSFVHADEPDDERRYHRGQHRTDHRRQPHDSPCALKVEAETDAGEHRMRNRSGDVAYAPDHHVASYYAEGHARDYSCEKGIPDKGNGRVGEGAEELTHARFRRQTTGDRDPLHGRPGARVRRTVPGSCLR